MKTLIFTLPFVLISCIYFFQEEEKSWPLCKWIHWDLNGALAKTIHKEQVRQLKNSQLPEKFMLMIDGELVDCEDGYTVDLARCARYIADSLVYSLDQLYDSLTKELNISIYEDQQALDIYPAIYDPIIEEQILHNKQVKKDLIQSQNDFLRYFESQNNLNQTLIEGNERVIHQNNMEIIMLENRIDELRWLFDRWNY